MSQVDYGKALRVARAARGMTKRALAQAAGVSPTYASYIENGKRIPSAEAIASFARALHLPPWALVYLGTDNGNPTVGALVMGWLQGPHGGAPG